MTMTLDELAEAIAKGHRELVDGLLNGTRELYQEAGAAHVLFHEVKRLRELLSPKTMQKLYRIDPEDIPTTLDNIQFPYPLTPEMKERAERLDCGDSYLLKWEDLSSEWLSCCGTPQEWSAAQTLFDYLPEPIALAAARDVVASLTPKTAGL